MYAPAKFAGQESIPFAIGCLSDSSSPGPKAKDLEMSGGDVVGAPGVATLAPSASRSPSPSSAPPALEALYLSPNKHDNNCAGRQAGRQQPHASMHCTRCSSALNDHV